MLYDEFLPHVLHQHQQVDTSTHPPTHIPPTHPYTTHPPTPPPQTQTQELITYPSFDAAVDEFFAQVEEQKLQQAATAQEEAVKAKLVRIQRENEARLEVGGLREENHSSTLLMACLTSHPPTHPPKGTSRLRKSPA